MEWEVAVGVALTLSAAVAKMENYRFHLSGAEEKQRRVTLLCQIFRSTKGETKGKREKKRLVSLCNMMEPRL